MDAERVALGSAAGATRRQLGPTAWAVLEAMFSRAGARDGDLVVETSARSLAVELGLTSARRRRCVMLRVTSLHASSAAASAAYYTQYLTQAVGEVLGVWHGAQAAGLGLAGVVTGDALQLLLEGRDPTSGTPLGTPLVDRYRADGRKIEAVAGFDATFSAPKSLSVLWALTGDDRVLAVHDQAVAVALAHLERFGATTRVRVNGARQQPDTHGLSVAVFRQSTSRADDPQLHTHVVISTKVQAADGRWWALDARYLKRHQRMLVGLYQTAVRAGMRHELGVAWGPVVNGQAEIAGMPVDLLTALSKPASGPEGTRARVRRQAHRRGARGEDRAGRRGGMAPSRGRSRPELLVGDPRRGMGAPALRRARPRRAHVPP
jgi:conjugative relaxase-like TrwC/TraI family protein